MKINEIVTEAVNTVPHDNTQFKKLEEILSKPLAASIAREVIYDVIDDDDLNSKIDEVAEKNIIEDVRPMIIDWIKLNMPDLLTPRDLHAGQKSPIGSI